MILLAFFIPARAWASGTNGHYIHTAAGARLDGTTVTAGKLDVIVTAGAPGVSAVRWTLDGLFLGRVTRAPFTQMVTVKAGVHRLAAQLESSSGTTQASAQFSASSSNPPPSGTTSPTAAAAPAKTLSGFFGPSFTGNTWNAFAHQVYSISGSTLTVSYPAGSSSPGAGPPYGGAQLCAPFSSGSGGTAVLTYRVRFPVGFQFVQGGKLPGIYGGVGPFSGGNHNSRGWSMRLMWRNAGAGEVYGYISNTTGYGDDWGSGNFRWKADGQWHTVVERVRVNSPGRSDGWVTLDYNGVRVINQTGLAVTTTNTPATGLFFSTFYGGHDRTWSPTANQHIDFAGFSGSAS